ncbi:TIGR03862 family flavoprotein [Sulfitobacter pseudonitzschiae]|uniref:TIGR03862 family flavoprotein n=1 Tax=Pseudosulfitobacter pseudonitzschiae TaxID=1402135 RepID=A0A9Q2RSS4_9RHOB|nr:TIGR03862 family flavoprotein [Pseudosulfitobacter pseudonitzschiae]MBM2295319.1 TIGR03862 family flavoprotein [Pseudosulfitobacter pseudonitzschiae]MBM2300231.1 TIGR03862 family flavoprotein [Pseudosulfitobacter pseudonitzschiae]MBM2310016.1 TIGR03862 family flavoprotein [Pseudosulfitobacter pseudonitzschiae]MBM2314928.1 TIGR03862 family flavoprotein [Pseudosulfitobacter pseudonitzschiae]
MPLQHDLSTKTAAVIGAGPAGLMAAEVLAQAGVQVCVYDAKPSVGRKFLMAGKSGLNLTMDAPLDAFVPHYAEAAATLRPILQGFDAAAVQDWARGLGQEVFTGSSGRVFPRAMKASPLLRAWLVRLNDLGVQMQTRWRWTGFDGDALTFDQGRVTADVTVLALGGASWARLGSDGAWADILRGQDIAVAPFGAANVGLQVEWSAHMAPHYGQPVKAVAWQAGDLSSRGEAILSAKGLEGGGIYSIARAVREGAALTVDLMPDQTVQQVAARLAKKRGKESHANHIRKTLKLEPLKLALLQEWARPLPQDPQALAGVLKALPVAHIGLRPLDEAISTSGGLSFDALDDALMLKARPGTFAAGEMLDWEAPTGGYLITACMATGRWAAQGAVAHLQAT